MATAFKESQKFYQKFIFGMKANFYAKFEVNLRTSTYHPLHDFYMNLYLKYTISPREIDLVLITPLMVYFIYILLNRLVNEFTKLLKYKWCLLPRLKHHFKL